MLRQENSYRFESDSGETSGWNIHEIAAQMPYLYSVGRNKTNGRKVVKARNFPGYSKVRGSANVMEAFTNQDKIRRDWQEIELKGELPHLYLNCTFGEVRLNQDLAEYFLQTSEIAELYVRGWRFTAK